MNAIIQAFFYQLAGFALMAITYVCHFYQQSAEHRKMECLYPFYSKIDLILFIVIWFGFGTYFTWKFNWGIFA